MDFYVDEQQGQYGNASQGRTGPIVDLTNATAPRPSKRPSARATTQSTAPVPNAVPPAHFDNSNAGGSSDGAPVGSEELPSRSDSPASQLALHQQQQQQRHAAYAHGGDAVAPGAAQHMMAGNAEVCNQTPVPTADPLQSKMNMLMEEMSTVMAQYRAMQQQPQQHQGFAATGGQYAGPAVSQTLDQMSMMQTMMTQLQLMQQQVQHLQQQQQHVLQHHAHHQGPPMMHPSPNASMGGSPATNPNRIPTFPVVGNFGGESLNPAHHHFAPKPQRRPLATAETPSSEKEEFSLTTQRQMHQPFQHPRSANRHGSGRAYGAGVTSAITCLVEFKRQRIKRYNSAEYVVPGQYVIVEGDRGQDCGLVVLCTVRNGDGSIARQAALDAAPPDSSRIKPETGRVLRVATERDVDLLHGEIASDEQIALRTCRELAARLGLKMNIVDCEFQFDRKKISFFFESNEAVDFRELNTELYRKFGVRIWLENLNSKVKNTVPDGAMSHADKVMYAERGLRVPRPSRRP